MKTEVFNELTLKVNQLFVFSSNGQTYGEYLKNLNQLAIEFINDDQLTVRLFNEARDNYINADNEQFNKYKTELLGFFGKSLAPVTSWINEDDHYSEQLEHAMKQPKGIRYQYLHIKKLTKKYELTRPEIGILLLKHLDRMGTAIERKIQSLSKKDKSSNEQKKPSRRQLLIDLYKEKGKDLTKPQCIELANKWGYEPESMSDFYTRKHEEIKRAATKLK